MLSLLDVKNQLIRHTQDNRIDDNDIIDAVNDFYSIVQRLDQRHSPEKYRGTSALLSIDNTGYDLAGLTDLGNIKSLKVWNGDKLSQNLRMRTFEGSNKQGYYLGGQTLFLTPVITDSQPLYISYIKKTARVAQGAILANQPLLIDQDLERALRLYLKHSFFEGGYQFDLRDDAENKAIEEITRYFSASPSSRSW